jgi:hypothetical protein
VEQERARVREHRTITAELAQSAVELLGKPLD